MKVFAGIALCIVLLTGCSYNYNLGVSESTPVEELTEVEFSNRIKVSAIDGEAFERKKSIWVGGSHTVRLKPGLHTFRFTYNAVSLKGGSYTTKPMLVAGILKAGKRYKISHSIERSNIYFNLTEAEGDSPET